MAYFSRDDINKLDHVFRINLVNSCSGFKSANLIGSISSEGFENVAVFSSVTHLGSNPPLLGFFLRPTTVPRNTYLNIKSTKYYTINHINEACIKDAHHTSAKYDASISEFEVTSLHPEYKDNFKAPFVKKAPLQLAMEYVEEYSIQSNNTILLIGKINGIYINDNILEDDGFINLSKANIATINGLDGYAIPKYKERFGYQHPKTLV